MPSREPTPIEDRITEDEWALVQILSHPVLFREFINEEDTDRPDKWEPLERHERAWTTCDNPFIAMCCGRSVHKTTSMIEMLYYWVINNKFIPGDPGLFVMVPNKSQKDLSFFRIRSACIGHWLIKHWVMPGNINITEGKIEFKNGFQFLMRIAGAAGSDANVIGVHTSRIWVDEAQEFPWQTWLSLQNCLKEEIPGYQMFVSGVPNGARTENVLYYADQEAQKYMTFNISQEMMSWWTPEMEFSKRVLYKAIYEDTEDYKHYVLGQHGMVAFSVFDRNRFTRDEFETQKNIYTMNSFEKSIRHNPDGTLNYHVEEVILCPPLPFNVKNPRIGLGYDVGFSPDPAVFFIMYEHSVGEWRNLVRIVLERVEYPLQRMVLAWLDNVYHFNFMGIDMGGPGKVQYQDLTSESSEYSPHNFKERLFPVEFGGYRVVAITEDGEEKKDQIKRISVEDLSRWIHEGRFVFSSKDTDLMEELERTKFTRTITGEPVYRTDNDHQMAAFMCAIEAFEHLYGVPVLLEKRPLNIKLLGAEWLVAMD